MDIALFDAMICWDRDSKKALVVRHPDYKGASDSYSSTVGACFSYWRERDDFGRKLQLMIEVWHAVNFYDIPPNEMHTALLVIPEYRSMLADDCLPVQFRAERWGDE